MARETRDGWVCVSLRDQGTGGSSPLYFICPLPEGAGFKIALNDPDPQNGGFPVGCTVGSTVSIEPVTGLSSLLPLNSPSFTPLIRFLSISKILSLSSEPTFEEYPFSESASRSSRVALHVRLALPLQCIVSRSLG